MTKIQALWIIGLNIASYLLVKAAESVKESSNLTETFIKYIDANLYYTFFLIVLNIAILFFILRRHSKKDTATITNNSIDTATIILREIALNVANSEIAMWTHDVMWTQSDIRFSPVHSNNLWKEWFHSKWITNTLKETDLDDFNFGDRYYLYDLINQRRINIPTGVDVRNKKVGDTIKIGMVLMLRKYDHSTPRQKS